MRLHLPRFLAAAPSGLLLATALFAGTARAEDCSARTCTATNTVHVHVGTMLQLAAPASPLGTGVGLGPTALVRSNGTWNLEVSSIDSATVRLTLVSN